jgi:hypothetical protein
MTGEYSVMFKGVQSITLSLFYFQVILKEILIIEGR